MAHRQALFSLVLFSGWSPSVEWLESATRSRKRLLHEPRNPVTGAAYFRLWRIVMRGFNRTATVMCASLILESTLSG
jgi:hypothetical protein